MPYIKIAVINESTVVTDAEVRSTVSALQIQASRDFAPVWGVDAELTFVPKGSPGPAGQWWLVVLDNSDQAGALGYHDLTPDALPLGKVFAGSDKQYGTQWTVTASHELLEMLGDPDINLCATATDANGSMRLYAYEVADACESDQYGYSINGVLVSDFVYPAWFESFRQAGSTQFDFQKKINEPFQLLPGGYIGICDVNTTNGWTQLTAPGAPAQYAARAHVGSRRERRRIPRSHWVRSQITTPKIPPAKKGNFKTFRNPVFSVFQSFLNQALKRRRGLRSALSIDEPEMQQFHQALTAKIHTGRAAGMVGNRFAAAAPGALPPVTVLAAHLSCAQLLAEMAWAEITANSARSSALANEITGGGCDPLWAECVTSYLKWKAQFWNSTPYTPYTNMSDYIINLPAAPGANPLTVAVIADWGTGMQNARWLLEQVLAHNPDVIIHLGDIYYAGTADETQTNFLDVLAGQGVDVSSFPVYTLAGNHDMYSGGVGYYGLLQKIRQPASFFCLRNAKWQILAMDTGYNDRNPFTVDSNITSLYAEANKPAETAWHLDKINNAAGRKTILLSHHQLFSPFGDSGIGQDASGKHLAVNPSLYDTFKTVLPNIALWLWGHEHTCNIFEPYIGLGKGRCIGAGAIPDNDDDLYKTNTTLISAPQSTDLPKLKTDPNTGNQYELGRNADGTYFHCYTILKLSDVDGASTAEYCQVDSVDSGRESLLFSEPI